MIKFEIDCNDGKGESSACHHVGEYFSVVKDDHARAAKVYELNCASNKYGPSCFNLGRFYLGGRGVAQNDVKAESLFEKACDSNHLPGCYLKAVLLYSSNDANLKKELKAPDGNNGQKLNEKQIKAMKLMDSNCNQGDVDSCFFAGVQSLRKDNLDRNPMKALDYLSRSCNANHAPSCYNLAVMYRNGDIQIEKNEAKFIEYRDRTNELMTQSGGMGGVKKA